MSRFFTTEVYGMYMYDKKKRMQEYYKKYVSNPANVEKRNKKTREWYHKNLIRERAKRAKWYPMHREQARAYGKMYARLDRLKVIDHYSNKRRDCACCGEPRIEFLSIDHINGNGHQQRDLGLRGNNLIRWIIKNNFPPEYQILCFNCNQAKNFGECPHKIEAREKMQYLLQKHKII